MSEADLPSPFGLDAREQRLSWDLYARSYDTVCEFNPPYQENIAAFKRLLPSLGLPSNPRVCDVGAGTGNYVIALTEDFPNARVTHLDADPRMNLNARIKYQNQNVRDVTIVEKDFREAEFPEASFDFVICVNVLYSIPQQEQALEKIGRWIDADGRMFVIDFGRKIRMLDWAWYMTRVNVANHGVRRYLQTVRDNFEYVRQNRKAKVDFESGVFATHSTEDFRSLLEGSGFAVESLSTCYRGYCDMALCRVEPALPNTS